MELLPTLLPALGVLAGLGAKAGIDLLLEGRRWRREDRLRDLAEKRATYRDCYQALESWIAADQAVRGVNAGQREIDDYQKVDRLLLDLRVDLNFLAPRPVSKAMGQAVLDLRRERNRQQADRSIMIFIQAATSDLETS